MSQCGQCLRLMAAGGSACVASRIGKRRPRLAHGLPERTLGLNSGLIQQALHLLNAPAPGQP